MTEQSKAPQTLLEQVQAFYNTEADESGDADIRVEEINERIVYHFQDPLFPEAPGDPKLIAIPQFLTMGEFSLFDSMEDAQKEEPCLRVISKTCYANPKTEKKGFDRAWLNRLSVADGRAVTDIFRCMVLSCIGAKKKRTSKTS